MIYPIYEPTNGPFPPRVENSRMKVFRTACDGGNDVAYADGFVYLINAAGNGSLRICTADERAPQILSELTGFGNLRQIEVAMVGKRRIAAMTARECGLYLVDVTDAAAPFLCCHYNTVEFATGIALCGVYAAIGCRSFGVELIDISDPEAPRHISVIRAGEVQSVYIADGILYTGSWGEKQVNMFDIRDVAFPRFLSSVPLEGRGDGLCVRDGILYAAFGQHLRPATGDDPSDFRYGRGNGFAIWDVCDPKQPKQLSVTVFPHRFHAHWDLWDVTLCGHYAVVSHTLNGVWIYDVSDPCAPIFCDHIAIETDADFSEIIVTNDHEQATHPIMLPFDHTRVMYAPVTGVAAAAGRLYIAVRFQDLHIASADYFSESPAPVCTLSEGEPSYYVRYAGDACDGVRIVPTAGQAHGVAYRDGLIYVACGMEGILIYDRNGVFLGCTQTDGFAFDIRRTGDLFCVAAGGTGVILFRADGNTLREVGRFNSDGKSCSQVVPSENGRFLMVHATDRDLIILDISDPTNPNAVAEETRPVGLLYHRQISHGGACGQYYGCFWNGQTISWYDLSGDAPIRTVWEQESLGFTQGITGLDIPDHALVVRKGGYSVFDIRTERYGDVIMVGGMKIFGKPVVYGSLLFVTDRLRGDVVICDISEIQKPVLLRKLNFSGHPDLVCPFEGGAVIPLGHQGFAILSL